MYGFTGKILVVDVGEKTFMVLEKDAAFYRKYTGGALLCAALFAGHTAGKAHLTPFSTENPLVFATGPMAGGKVCGATRVNLMSLAPESTGIYLSQAGGEFGPALKRAGFDALVVSGRSEQPVVVVIENESVSFKEATPWWGTDRISARSAMIDEFGEDFCLAVIGPAGENRAVQANIMFEPEHYAGRGGLGAVMGDKKIKAIAVRGNREAQFRDPQAVKSVNQAGGRALAQKIKKNPGSFMGVLRHLGTFGLLSMNQKSGNLPTRNFTAGSPKHPETLAWLSPQTAADAYVGRINPCRSCFVACKKGFKADPAYSSLAEYESVATLGPNLGLEDDFDAGLAACELCNRLGMDTISTGNMIAWLMQGFESGAITEKETGFAMGFGEGKKAIALITDMAYRKTDLGSLLADGIEAAIGHFGPHTRAFSRFVRGIGMPAHMPGKKPGIGFGYFHGPNPNDHMKAEHDWIASDPESLNALGVSVTSAPDALDSAKVDVYRATQFYYAAMDALSLCLFVFAPGNVYCIEEILQLVNAATGFELDFTSLMEIGERTVQLQRKLYLDFGGEDEPCASFGKDDAGSAVTRAEFEAARRHYYNIMGWDEQGRPLPETLSRLGL